MITIRKTCLIEVNDLDKKDHGKGSAEVKTEQDHLALVLQSALLTAYTNYLEWLTKEERAA
jgi:hypothetical protein